VDTLWHLLQQCRGDLFVRGVILEVDGNEQLLSLLINITNIDTTFMSEENPVSLKRKVSR